MKTNLSHSLPMMSIPPSSLSMTQMWAFWLLANNACVGKPARTFWEQFPPATSPSLRSHFAKGLKMYFDGAWDEARYVPVMLYDCFKRDFNALPWTRHDACVRCFDSSLSSRRLAPCSAGLPWYTHLFLPASERIFGAFESKCWACIPENFLSSLTISRMTLRTSASDQGVQHSFIILWAGQWWGSAYSCDQATDLQNKFLRSWQQTITWCPLHGRVTERYVIWTEAQILAHVTICMILQCMDASFPIDVLNTAVGLWAQCIPIKLSAMYLNQGEHGVFQSRWKDGQITDLIQSKKIVWGIIVCIIKPGIIKPAQKASSIFGADIYVKKANKSFVFVHFFEVLRSIASCVNDTSQCSRSQATLGMCRRWYHASNRPGTPSIDRKASRVIALQGSQGNDRFHEGWFLSASCMEAIASEQLPSVGHLAET